jgi:hypothetical protein
MLRAWMAVFTEATGLKVTHVHGFDGIRPIEEVLDTESRVCFTGGTEGEAPPREKETNMTQIDQVALDLIDALLREDGEFERDPGQVLYGLAEATGHDYKACSLGVLYLESMGFVEVERRDAPEAHKANRLIRIRLV